MNGLIERSRVLRDYLRAAWWRMLGARLGARVRIGKRCELHGPGSVALGERCVLEPDVVLKLVEPGARFEAGANVFIGRGCIFDVSGRFSIGDGALIAPGVFVTDHNHGTAPDHPIWQQPCPQADVRIGKNVWIGAGVIVLPGVSIGDGAVIAAGAVVTADVAPSSVVAGVPARFLRSLI